MKKTALMIILSLIVCLVAWLPAGLHNDQIKQTTQQRVLKSQTDVLQAKVNQLERELEMLKRVIRISGANVDILADGNVKIRARNISVEAGTNAQFKGTMVTVQSTGPNTIKGMPVLIN